MIFGVSCRAWQMSAGTDVVWHRVAEFGINARPSVTWHGTARQTSGTRVIASSICDACESSMANLPPPDRWSLVAARSVEVATAVAMWAVAVGVDDGEVEGSAGGAGRHTTACGVTEVKTGRRRLATVPAQVDASLMVLSAEVAVAVAVVVLSATSLPPPPTSPEGEACQVWRSYLSRRSRTPLLMCVLRALMAL